MKTSLGVKIVKKKKKEKGNIQFREG